MAYTKTVWKDRVVEKPRNYTKTDNADGTITLTPSPGVVTEAGTPIIAASLNNMDQGIFDAHTQLADKASKTVENPIYPTLLNAWVNTGGVNTQTSYWKDDMGIVHIRGQIKSGANTSIFFLPTGYKPLNTEHFAVITGGGIGEVYIQSDGAVIFYSGSNSWVSLSSITFRAGV